MERHAEILKYKAKRSLGDVMLQIDRIAATSPEHVSNWLRNVVSVAKEVYPHHENLNTRQIENVWLRQAVMYITYWLWKDKVGYKFVGEELALALGRETPYNHATVIHACKCHENYIRFKWANQEYVILFTTFREQLKERGLL